MRTSGIPRLALAGAALATCPLFIPTGGFGALGVDVALSAAELRWERLAACLAAGEVLSVYALGSAGLVSAPAAWLVLLLGGADAASGELLLALGGGAAPLWGAPTHLGVATGCAQCALLLATTALSRRGVTRAAGGALALLVLGLLWNATQALAQLSWAWDWIELAPFCLLASAVLASHGWARSGLPAPATAYLAFLQVSRAALLASAHHLQPPRGEGA